MEQICMIVDLDGYKVKHQPFIVRELGLYSVSAREFELVLGKQVALPLFGKARS